MNFRKIKHQLTPAPRFKKELWQKLEAEWQAEKLPGDNWYQTRLFRYAVVTAVVVMIIGSGGTGAYAYVSPRVVEGSKLYPIKQNLEKIVEKTKFTPQAKAQFYLKQIQRREAELKVLEQLRRKAVNTQKRLQVMEDNLQRAQVWLENKQIKNPVLEQQLKKRLDQRQLNIQKQKEALRMRKDKTKKALAPLPRDGK